MCNAVYFALDREVLTDVQPNISRSWFNPDEAQHVKMYVDLLVKDTRKNKCKPEDIGIIAPYHRQVQKIRMLLCAHGYSDIKVGSVEEFQGSERPVIKESLFHTLNDQTFNLSLFEL